MHCPCLAAACATEWKGRSAAIGRQQGGRARIGQREGAGPPSGMYYGVSGTSVRAGQARTPFGAPEGGTYRGEGSGRQGAQAQRADWVTCCARARRRPRTRARVRANACARTGLSVWVTWRTKLRLLPAPPPFPPSGFLSFLFFLLIFFSMNTHRVHLKATLPHFTASVGFLLLRFPLQFKWEKKNNRM